MEVKMIQDSISPAGIRMSSIQMKAPKFIDASVEKHRGISSNSSSDRAIPFEKNMNREIFLPDDVRKNQPGMQGDENISETELKNFHIALRGIWSYTAGVLSNFTDIHKQHLNRYLLPFSYQDKIMTATEEQWKYFLMLRDHKHADPAIRDVAKKVKECLKLSRPQELQPGDWHLPFIEDQKDDSADWRLVSVARCARVSYLNHDKSDPDVEKDITLAKRLMKDKHWSCFEHQVTPMIHPERNTEMGLAVFPEGVTHWDRNGFFWSGNHKGWIQFRKLVGG